MDLRSSVDSLAHTWFHPYTATAANKAYVKVGRRSCFTSPAHEPALQPCRTKATDHPTTKVTSAVQWYMPPRVTARSARTHSEEIALNKTYPASRARQEASVLDRCMQSAVHARQEVLVVPRALDAVFHEFHGFHAVHVGQVLAEDPNALQVALVHEQVLATCA